jgi:hydrogenase expression/formation protein HypD
LKYVDEFRDPKQAQALLSEIRKLTEHLSTNQDKSIKLMEVCGGHTHAIFQHGLLSLLPDQIELIHGPGCPVCVIPIGRLDQAIALAQDPNVIFTTFGDVLRVPGSKQSLQQARATGADIRIVYSPLDALQVARDNPDREVVFFAIGFETTAPSTALTILQAEKEEINNFSILCHHVTIVPALQSLLADPNLDIQGLIGPGHVSMVIGTQPYQFIPDRYHKPVVVSGFEPLDLLQSIWLLLLQMVEGRCQVENQYARLVNVQGNPIALESLDRVFELRDRFEWRGLGDIIGGGLQLKYTYRQFDAEHKFIVPHHQVADAAICQCGEILKGRLKPWQCQVFGTACTPTTPIGTCMVSSEGACAAYYKYGGRSWESKTGELH